MYRRSVFLLSDNASSRIVKSIGPFHLCAGPAQGVFEIVANDEKRKLNLLDEKYFTSLRTICDGLSHDREARVAIFTAAEGQSFSGGLDLKSLQSGSMRWVKPSGGKPQMPAMPLHDQRAVIRLFQDCVSSLARCRVPVICAMDRHCIGGATSLATACDIRYATRKTDFTVKEAAVGIAADIGVLQRLPAIVGEGRARELAFTARVFDGSEAKAMGFVEDVYDDYASMIAAARHAAVLIANNSPLAVQSTKHMMNWQKERVAQESLEYMAAWNAFTIPSEDVVEAAVAFSERRPPAFTNYLSSEPPR